MSSSRSHCWVFTLNNPSKEDIRKMEVVFLEKCVDFSAQVETSSTGTKHIQGYCQFHRYEYFNTVRKYFGNRAHIEKARKAVAARRYCLKKYTRTGRQWSPGFESEAHLVLGEVAEWSVILKLIDLYVPKAVPISLYARRLSMHKELLGSTSSSLTSSL